MQIRVWSFRSITTQNYSMAKAEKMTWALLSMIFIIFLPSGCQFAWIDDNNHFIIDNGYCAPLDLVVLLHFTEIVCPSVTKRSEMMEARSKYYMQEQETWQKTLDYIQQQNIALKNSIANISGSQITRELLDRLEQFQNKFIEKDALIILLRRDIVEQGRLLESNSIKGSQLEKINQKQDRLRKDMEQMEKEFSSLKFNFNNCMAAVL